MKKKTAEQIKQSAAELKIVLGCFPTLKALALAIGEDYTVLQAWFKNGVPTHYCPTLEKLSKGKARCENLDPTTEWGVLRNSPI